MTAKRKKTMYAKPQMRVYELRQSLLITTSGNAGINVIYGEEDI